jgi:two-component system, NtrC family, nitrogen regulation sensor histidine kinase NtrY
MSLALPVLRCTGEWRSMASDLRKQLIFKVALLTFFIFLSVILYLKDFSFYLVLVASGVAGFNFYKLIWFVEERVPSNTQMPNEVQFDEISQSFKSSNGIETADTMSRLLNDALTKIKSARREQDSDLQFFKNVVQHIGIGLIAFRKDGGIQIANSAAKRLLRLTRTVNISDLREVSEPLVDAVLKLKTGGRELVPMKMGDETFQLSVYAIELTLRGEELKLISITNIQSELEEKEMEAWQNLVRVLTHEIMNSVTPISSLAEMAEQDLSAHLKDQKGNLKKEQLEDMYLSLQTISKRSEGLIRFVKEFRNLTHIPKAKLADVAVKPLLDDMALLHRKEMADKGITIEVNIKPEQLIVSADKNMIEQVIINLIKNAIQSFDEQTVKNIWLTGAIGNKGRPTISVRDNGNGIDPEALEKIFIPFFSTKKTGSGIGLSLSKQIMRQHEGRITVHSKLGEGTEFILRF